MLDGLSPLTRYYVRKGAEGRVIARPRSRSGKVGIVTGGDRVTAVFTGYLGPGLLDACAIGEVFASLAAELMADAFAPSKRLRASCAHGIRW